MTAQFSSDAKRKLVRVLKTDKKKYGKLLERLGVKGCFKLLRFFSVLFLSPSFNNIHALSIPHLVNFVEHAQYKDA